MLLPGIDLGRRWGSPLLTVIWTLSSGGSAREEDEASRQQREGPGLEDLKEQWLCARETAKLPLLRGDPSGQTDNRLPQGGKHMSTVSRRGSQHVLQEAIISVCGLPKSQLHPC